MELDYELTADDLKQAWYADVPLGAVGVEAGRWTAACLGLVGLVILHLDHKSLAGWVAVSVGVILFTIGTILRYRVKVILREHAAGVGPVHLMIDEAGVTTRTPGSETRTAWAAFVDAHESDGGFLLYRTKVSFWFIPMRALAAAEDVDTLRELLSHKITSRGWQ